MTRPAPHGLEPAATANVTAPRLHARLLEAADLAGRVPLWAERARRCPDATVFAAPLFQMALREIWPHQHRGQAMAVMRATPTGDAIAGLLPLADLPLARGPFEIREVGFARNAHTLRNHLLMPPDPEAVGAMLVVWKEETESDTLLLENLCGEGLPGLIHATALEMGLWADPPRDGRRLMIADLADDYQAYLASRSGQFRRQIRKHRRALEGAGTLGIERLTGKDLRRAIPAWRQVVAASWQGRAAPESVANTDEDWALHHALSDCGALWIARLDGRPVAALRMLEDTRTAYVHTMHFDQNLKALAPGITLFDEMMRNACTRALARVDFNGSSAFFARWATGHVQTRTLRIYRPGLRAGGARAARSILHRFRAGVPPST